MQRLLILLTALSLLLAYCGTLEIRLDTGTTDETRGNGPASSSPEPAAATLRMDSTSEQIQQAMLKSATKWQTIWMDGTVTAYFPDGSPVQVQGPVITFCNFRGDPISEVTVANVPPEFQGFIPNRLIDRNGTLYLSSDSPMMVVMTDRKGAFKAGVDLFSLMDIKPDSIEVKERKGHQAK